MFLGTVIGYSDGQAYGFAALFGLVEDLKLFTATFVDGHAILDTSKYQLTSGITSLGGAAVSMRMHLLITRETLTALSTLQAQYLLLFPAQLLPAGIVYGAMLIYIGLTAILTIVCQNFAQIMALRYVLIGNNMTPHHALSAQP